MFAETLSFGLKTVQNIHFTKTKKELNVSVMASHVVSHILSKKIKTNRDRQTACERER